MAKYISSFDLALYADISLDEVNDILIDSMLDVTTGKITQDDYILIKDSFDVSSQSKIDRFFGVQTDVKFQFNLFGTETEIKPRKPKTKVVLECTWEADNYLPNLEESKNYKYKFFDSLESPLDEEIIFDIEIYGNYFLIMFLGFRTGKCWYFEKTETQELDCDGIRWFIDNHTLISFNGIKFDLPLLAIALNGNSLQDLWRATEMLINDENGLRPYQILKQFKAKQIECDHIDLIEVAPLKGSLKLYGARMHCPNLQDLPFKVGINLNQDQIDIVRRYCVNDVETTAYLYNKLIPQIVLRKDVTTQYRVDARSKSDPQCAELIIKAEVEQLSGRKLYPNKDIDIDHVMYNIPDFIKFESEELSSILDTIRTEKFYIENGTINAGYLEGLTVELGGATIRCGIGGLHSSEEVISHYEDDEYMIMDADVTSYYPSIIINQKLAPEILGDTFLKVYRGAKEKRVIAKKNGDKATDAMYKLLLNGSFGKFGSQYSVLFAPKLLIQVTVTGQLSLLMLSEQIAKAGYLITSINTDGETIKFKRSDESDVKRIISEWEKQTGFDMEYAYYKSTHSRDINNYYACKTDGSIKRKGSYGEETLSKNPQNVVCTDAVSQYLLGNDTLENHVMNCKDVRKFLTIRNVTGGAIKDTEYLGKTVRFYHSTSTSTGLRYAKSGNAVPTSDKCRPMMKLTRDIPVDLDYDWYVNECYRILKDIGVKIV